MVVSTWVRRHGITVPPADMPRLDRIVALADPAEQAEAAAMVEAEAWAEATGRRRSETRRWPRSQLAVAGADLRKTGLTTAAAAHHP
jgi:hypothetical protein